MFAHLAVPCCIGALDPRPLTAGEQHCHPPAHTDNVATTDTLITWQLRNTLNIGLAARGVVSAATTSTAPYCHLPAHRNNAAKTGTTLANFVPAAAVRQRGIVFSVWTRCKEQVGGYFSFFSNGVIRQTKGEKRIKIKQKKIKNNTVDERQAN